MIKRQRLVETGRIVRSFVHSWIEEDSFGVGDQICPITLKGACAIASLALHQVLDDVMGLNPVFVTTEVPNLFGQKCHCWVVINNWTVDLTATQFGDWPEVMVVRSVDYDIVDLDASFDHSERKTYLNAEAFSRLPSWKRVQNPLTYAGRIKKVLDVFRC